MLFLNKYLIVHRQRFSVNAFLKSFKLITLQIHSFSNWLQSVTKYFGKGREIMRLTGRSKADSQRKSIYILTKVNL
jgi:hypothetical protein